MLLLVLLCLFTVSSQHTSAPSQMAQVYDDGIKIVSNQVQYSILDQRPNTKMAKAAEERGIKILAYGTLLGGFFSEKWLGQAEPRGFETVSQQKVRFNVYGVCLCLCADVG